jgi:hypothetical protein
VRSVTDILPAAAFASIGSVAYLAMLWLLDAAQVRDATRKLILLVPRAGRLY